jgi:hypothetical protein
MIDRDAFEARVRELMPKVGLALHDFVIREGEKHGAGPVGADSVSVAAYIAALSAVMGDELGSMATCFGPHGSNQVARSFLAAFHLGAGEMEAAHTQAEARLN